MVLTATSSLGTLIPNLSSASKIKSKVSSESRPNSSSVLSGLIVVISISNFLAIDC